MQFDLAQLNTTQLQAVQAFSFNFVSIFFLHSHVNWVLFTFFVYSLIFCLLFTHSTNTITAKANWFSLNQPTPEHSLIQTVMFTTLVAVSIFGRPETNRFISADCLLTCLTQTQSVGQPQTSSTYSYNSLYFLGCSYKPLPPCYKYSTSTHGWVVITQTSFCSPGGRCFFVCFLRVRKLELETDKLSVPLHVWLPGC